MGKLCILDKCKTEYTGRKVTRKHDDLQEIAYEMFGQVARQPPYAGYKQSQWSDGSSGANVVTFGRLMIKGQILPR
ncbi:hypothetical protein JOB18_047987 [Solea senegalensis]|uniref:Uncharacterized protein n=1 Tax=Solea senegalensis TaxID=28829 RepID=A0AAV6RUF9_SOLSE|nr:hypothetical protein JOB18_047987 [Solea senegalensis]